MHAGPPQRPDPVRKTPVILLSGFLGSGKTTVLKYLLHINHGFRIAVVRNEFSDEEITFEEPLLMRDENNDNEHIGAVLEFPNTCVCCSAKGKFIYAINELLKKNEQENKRPFDFVVAELSGLTDPVAVGDEFISSSDAEEDRMELGGFLCVINGADKRVFSRASEAGGGRASDLVWRFLGTADVVVVNKMDLEEEGLGRSELQKHVGRITDAPIYFTEFGKFDVAQVVCKYILGTSKSVKECPSICMHAPSPCALGCASDSGCREHGESGPGESAPGESGLGESGPGESAPGESGPGESAPGESAPGESANGQIKSVCYKSAERFDVTRFEDALCRWLWTETTKTVYRGKGLIRSQKGCWYELQVVGESVEMRALAPEVAIPQSSVTRVLFVGTNIHHADLHRLFATAL